MSVCVCVQGCTLVFTKIESTFYSPLFTPQALDLCSELPCAECLKPAVFSAQVYGEYKASLAFDLVSSRQKNVSKMWLHQLTKILGSIK